MPYKRNSELPAGVRGLPDGAQTIYRKAFNAALEQYGDEETAARVAWAAVKKKYRKDGDAWVLKEGVDATGGELSFDQRQTLLLSALRERLGVGAGQVAPDVWPVDTFDDFVIFTWNDRLYRADYAIDAEKQAVALDNIVRVVRKVTYEVAEGRPPRTVLLTSVEPLTVLAEATDEKGEKTFRYRGVALIDNVVSFNGYYYSKEANDAILEETNAFMKAGGICTVYSRHAKAKVGLPVGKVDKPLERSGNKVYYEARIAETTEGKDVQALIAEGVLGPSSIRSTDYEVKPMRVNGRQVMAVTRAIIAGIDLVDEASIEGAGITEVLTEGARIEEVNDMSDIKTITLAELRAARPDLLEEFDREKYQGVNGKIKTLEDQLAEAKAAAKALQDGQAGAIAAAVEEARKPLVEQLNGLQAEVDRRKLDEAIGKAVAGQPAAELLESVLRHGMTFGATTVKPVTKAEDLTEDALKAAGAVVEGMKKAAMVEAKAGRGSSQGGDVHLGEGPRINQQQDRILKLAR